MTGAATVTSSGSDLAGAATQGHGGHGGEKFFMYAHQPDKKQYEFGFKRGNDYHTIERYEKGGPHHNFKAKARSVGKIARAATASITGTTTTPRNTITFLLPLPSLPFFSPSGRPPRRTRRADYHDDHHGGYHDDHHDDHHGGYHDDHNDHGGYHSQPVPDFAPALASSSSPKVVGEREGRSYTPTAHHRRRSKATAAGNKVGVEKASGLEEKEPRKEVVPRKNKNGRKNYGFFNERRSFEYTRTFGRDGKKPQEKGGKEAIESSSAFPRASGFDQTPDLSDTKFYPRSSASSSSSSHSSPLLSSGSRAVSESRVYDEEAGVWYSLVPIPEP
ncbi:hypothetical protein C7M84_002883 [Penaeus vannamei]|uniref:Uncharacterized protein n=1 Tax=Penaeus vannamei TaxID=6689 RepID=A0A423TPM0_PENVA|nr:hypothetical protein C7M84_002883 [Penaeus vannamei]